MPKTTTFKYVSSKSSGTSFSPTSTENSASPSPTTTIFSSTTHFVKPERKPAPFGWGDRSTWLDATDSQPHEAFFYVELLCNIWFIVEFTTRFVVIIVYVKSFFSTFILGLLFWPRHIYRSCMPTIHSYAIFSLFQYILVNDANKVGITPVNTLKILFTNRFRLYCTIFRCCFNIHMRMAHKLYILDNIDMLMKFTCRMECYASWAYRIDCLLWLFCDVYLEKLTFCVWRHTFIYLLSNKHLFSLFLCFSLWQMHAHTGFTKYVGVYQVASKFSGFSVNVEFLLWDKTAFGRTNGPIWSIVNSAYIASV